MSTTSEHNCHCLTCLDYRSLKAQGEGFWFTKEGLTRRIDSLAQDFSYTVVNNAFKIVSVENEAKWLKWVDKGDTKVCKECLAKSKGGKNGFYRPKWFLPKMPVHPNCRCEWEIYFYDPF